MHFIHCFEHSPNALLEWLLASLESLQIETCGHGIVHVRWITLNSAYLGDKAFLTCLDAIKVMMVDFETRQMEGCHPMRLSAQLASV